MELKFLQTCETFPGFLLSLPDLQQQRGEKTTTESKSNTPERLLTNYYTDTAPSSGTGLSVLLANYERLKGHRGGDKTFQVSVVPPSIPMTRQHLQ